LQGLLLRAQDYLLRQFEDLELVLGSAEGRQQLLLLPYDALKAILQHPRLKVASENSALLAAAGWLAANTRQVNTLLLGPHGSHSGSSSGAVGAGSSGGGAPHKQAAGVEERAQAVYNSSLYNSNSSDVGASKAEGAHAGKAPPPAAAAAEAARQPGTPDAAAAVQPQQHQLPTASGVAALLLDLCQVLRLCQLSYTYAMHVLPHLPLFRDQPQLVAALQYEVLRYQAAGELRQRRLASEAAAAMNDAAASAGPPASLTAAGLQQQAAGGASAGGGDAAAHNGHAAAGAGSPAGVAAWVSATAQARASRPVHGWRAYDGSADASLLQCVRRPESALSALDFTFTFEPAALAGGQRTKPGSKRASTQQGGAPAADSANHGSSSSGGGNASAANAAAGAAVAAAGSGGVDLMQRLLGLASQQQEHGGGGRRLCGHQLEGGAARGRGGRARGPAPLPAAPTGDQAAAGGRGSSGTSSSSSCRCASWRQRRRRHRWCGLQDGRARCEAVWPRLCGLQVARGGRHLHHHQQRPVASAAQQQRPQLCHGHRVPQRQRRQPRWWAGRGRVAACSRAGLLRSQRRGGSCGRRGRQHCSSWRQPCEEQQRCCWHARHQGQGGACLQRGAVCAGALRVGLYRLCWQGEWGRGWRLGRWQHLGCPQGA
jgi:hypothetical protein